MPMIWSSEANVKLLVGMLAELKDQSVKLDYKKLAEHMGPECTTRSITNQFTKLKKQVAEAAEGMGRADDADGQAQSEARAEAPVRAGRKRKRGSVSGKGATARKKKKVQAKFKKEDEEIADEEED